MPRGFAERADGYHEAVTDRPKRRPGIVRRVLGAPFRKRRWIWLLILLLVLPWCWIKLFTPEVGPVSLPPIADRSWEIAVVVRSYHSSIVVERPEPWDIGQPGSQRSRFVEYGWGDRGFFMESNFWPHALFAAALLPSESVAYVRSHVYAPHEVFTAAEVYRRSVDSDTLRRLVISMEEAIVRTDDGQRSEPYAPVAEYRGRFYPGRESYIFWSGCNLWTLQRLAAAGLDVSATGVVLSSQVPDRLAGFQRVE